MCICRLRAITTMLLEFKWNYVPAQNWCDILQRPWESSKVLSKCSQTLHLDELAFLIEPTLPGAFKTKKLFFIPFNFPFPLSLVWKQLPFCYMELVASAFNKLDKAQMSSPEHPQMPCLHLFPLPMKSIPFSEFKNNKHLLNRLSTLFNS